MDISELHIAWHPDYVLPLPEGHRFPMEKYDLIPGQLLYEGCITADNLRAPGWCGDADLVRAHTNGYISKLTGQQLDPREQRVIGFPQSPQMISRERMITQGTIDCCRAALRHGVSLNVAGGTHHAFSDHGEGFCILNDFAVASYYLLANGLAKKVMIIDLDVHQGNGTAAIFAQESEVFTFSMHGQHNYPFRKSISDLDIGLPDQAGDAEYMNILTGQLPRLLDQFRPDFACYVAGVDVLKTDRFGKLSMTIPGCAARDAFVLQTLKSRNIPCAISMGGGYSPDIRTIVQAHVNTFKAAIDLYVH